MDKDSKRYSYSRLSTFKKCPRQHHYIYEELIPTKDSKETIPGSYFHKCMELIKKNPGKDVSKELDCLYKQYASQVVNGEIDTDEDQLEYTVTNYLAYYRDKELFERVLLVEGDFMDLLEATDKDDILVGKIDKVYEDQGLFNIVADYKTTLGNLKYTKEDVETNEQLLLYVPFAQNLLGIEIHAIEIDEVSMRKLQDVPLLKNGKPTVAKEKLSLVTYDAYYDKLKSMGLDNSPEYKEVLDYLQTRGHPLFRRTRVQLIDKNLIATNAEDIIETYKGAKSQLKFKNKGPLCNYCKYKELCSLDDHKPTDETRNIIIQKITTK